MIPRLHVVTDDDVIARPDTVEGAVRLIERLGSEVAIHVRGPRTPGGRLYDVGRRIHESVGGRFLFINDRVDVALCLNGTGVQLPARSFASDVARRLLGPDRRIGRSIRADGDQRVEAEIDFVIAGSAFRTLSHPNGAVAGIESIRKTAAASNVPVIAIGGISAERIGVLVRAGAHGIAVNRAVWSAPHPEKAALQLLAAWSEELERDGREDHE